MLTFLCSIFPYKVTLISLIIHHQRTLYLSFPLFYSLSSSLTSLSVTYSLCQAHFKRSSVFLCEVTSGRPLYWCSIVPRRGDLNVRRGQGGVEKVGGWGKLWVGGWGFGASIERYKTSNRTLTRSLLVEDHIPLYVKRGSIFFLFLKFFCTCRFRSLFFDQSGYLGPLPEAELCTHSGIADRVQFVHCLSLN